MNSETLWLLFAFFLVMDFAFAVLRASFIHARLPHLLNLRDTNPAQGDRALKILEKPYTTAVLRTSVAAAHYLLAAVGVMLLASLAAGGMDIWLLLGLVLLGGLLLLGLEFAVEGVVLRSAERWAMRMSGFAAALDILLRPFTAVYMRLLGPPESWQRARSGVTDDELRNWVEVGQTEGSLEQGERRMIYSIFQFGDTLTREIMVPRIDVFALDVDISPNEAIEAVMGSGHSRLPVYEEAIDNIIGLLYAKDLLRLQLDGNQSTSLRSLLRPAYFIPEAKKVDELLREMQGRSTHMAVVVDEYGGMAGIVTMEDIVEEIVGEIRDEYDQSEELLFQTISPEEYLFTARIDLEDVNELLGTHLTKDVADTLGGFIYGEVGRVPVGGEEVRVENWLLTVEQVSGRRIRLVRARLNPPEEKKENGQDEG